MNPIEWLASMLSERFSDVHLTLDPSDHGNGSWWLNVELQDQVVVVEWRPGKGFGVSSDSDEGYGDGPDEIYQHVDETYNRVTSLLLRRGKTVPPRAVLLRRLRESRHVSQVELAERLKVQQSAISKMERRSDMYISTLRNVVSAMGGTLEIRANFPDGIVRIIQFDDLEEEQRMADEHRGVP